MRGEEKYLYMLKNSYEYAAREKDYKESVVGSWEAHNKWADYDEYMMKYAKPWMNALEFGCGPGRNLVKYANRFKWIRGTDISEESLKHAELNLIKAGIGNIYNFPTNGYITEPYRSQRVHDFIFSCITIQHICSHDLRLKIFKDMFRSLKDGGRISIQMGYGYPSPRTVGYYENNYNAPNSNRACDVCVESYKQIENDLKYIGFKDFEFWIRPTGPGDIHPNWIFFTAVK